MQERIRHILASVGGLAVPVAAVGIEQDLFVAGLTSFATVTVMLAIEEEFDVQFDDSLLQRATFRNIAALMATVHKLQATRLAA